MENHTFSSDSNTSLAFHKSHSVMAPSSDGHRSLWCSYLSLIEFRKKLQNLITTVNPNTQIVSSASVNPSQPASEAKITPSLYEILSTLPSSIDKELEEMDSLLTDLRKLLFV